MKIKIDDVIYGVRRNLLHRGQNPRLVLELKLYNRFVFVQMDSNKEKPELNKLYKGYWCTKQRNHEVQFKIIEK